MKKKNNKTPTIDNVNRWSREFGKAKHPYDKAKVAWDGVFDLGPAAHKFMVLLMILTHANRLTIDVKYKDYTVMLTLPGGDHAVGQGEDLQEAMLGAFKFFERLSEK